MSVGVGRSTQACAGSYQERSVSGTDWGKASISDLGNSLRQEVCFQGCRELKAAMDLRGITQERNG